jgi:hypothetical protein
MTGQKKIFRIKSEDIEAALIDDSPVLVACIRETNLHEIFEKIKTVAAFFGPSLRVCYALEDLFPYFEKRFNIAGTPTYLLLNKGKAIDSLLGRNSAYDLVVWIMTQGRNFKKTVGNGHA